MTSKRHVWSALMEEHDGRWSSTGGNLTNFVKCTDVSICTCTCTVVGQIDWENALGAAWNAQDKCGMLPSVWKWDRIRSKRSSTLYILEPKSSEPKSSEYRHEVIQCQSGQSRRWECKAFDIVVYQSQHEILDHGFKHCDRYSLLCLLFAGTWFLVLCFQLLALGSQF